ncbi:MAG: NTP transferase domain-containing protein [Anaerolineae bacterium]|nr:NTP transferase domain-containing protein [Anaerolineae bacterium]
MKAVVLAGGKGTRLAPYTNVLPKPLMPIGEMPILEVLIRQMRNIGVDEVILTVGHLASLMQAYFQDGERFGVHINYSFEDAPLGTAGPLSLLKGLTETFIVTNGDVLTTLPLSQLVAFHKEQKAAATIAMHQRNVKINLGVIETNNDHTVTGYIEKPTFDYLVSMGIYVFEPAVLHYIPKGKYLDFPDLVKILIANGEHVCGFTFDGYWQDLGNPEDYQQANLDFPTLRQQIFEGE